MFKQFVALSMLFAIILAACGAPAADPVLPTLAPTTAADTPATTPNAEVESTPVLAAPEVPDVAPTTLAQTIVSETGITYQLPEGWVINDNDVISNFASDEDALFDFLSMEPADRERFILIGSVSVISPDEVSGVSEASSFDEAQLLLHEYFYTADADLQPPTVITLANGNRASVAIKNNVDIIGGAVGVFSYIDIGGTYIKLDFEGTASSMDQSVELRDAITNSITYNAG